MSPIDPKQFHQNEIGRLRGKIIRLLYESRPKPLDFASLRYMLDKQNESLSCRGLAAELEFLRSSKLLRVFIEDSDNAFDDVAQAKLLQRYSRTIGDEDDKFGASLTTRGVNFQEGHFSETGVVWVR